MKSEDETLLAEEVARLRAENKQIQKQRDAEKGWDARERFVTALAWLVAMTTIGGMLLGVGKLAYHWISAPDVVTQCRVEVCTGCSSGSDRFLVVGIVDWGSDHTYARFPTFAEAKAALDSMVCK